MGVFAADDLIGFERQLTIRTPLRQKKVRTDITLNRTDSPHTFLREMKAHYFLHTFIGDY